MSPHHGMLAQAEISCMFGIWGLIIILRIVELVAGLPFCGIYLLLLCEGKHIMSPLALSYTSTVTSYLFNSWFEPVIPRLNTTISTISTFFTHWTCWTKWSKLKKGNFVLQHLSYLYFYNGWNDLQLSKLHFTISQKHYRFQIFCFVFTADSDGVPAEWGVVR